MATKGLKVLSRKSYEAHAVSEFDNPLAYRYDENDALMYFDDVKVPWERIFVHRDPDMCRRQFHDAPGTSQAAIAQRQPPPPHCPGQRHHRARRQSPGKTVLANAKNDEADEPHESQTT